jgi:hypothetical protein
LSTSPLAEALGASVDLRYVARAGLLPELSRQTYDRFYKAVREAVLNSVDADASHVTIDLRTVADRDEFAVIDDGIGMSTRELCEHFMSLGGSGRFGDASRYGRIGIGSLALLQYGKRAIVETKRAGSTAITVAEIEHPWQMSRDTRRAHIDEIHAGVAQEFAYDGDVGDHFTRVRILGLQESVAVFGSDIPTFYRLVEDLRRVLPLPLGSSPTLSELKRFAPAVAEEIAEHVQKWSIPVTICAPWDPEIVLTRRLYGDEEASGESWNGHPIPISKNLTVTGDEGRRQIRVVGFLLGQTRAIDSWSGLTARVQNVAVEERTFFDVTSDAGFRKYVTGEIWILGDVDRGRLINIDRSSFNKECDDYQVLQRFLSRMILDFKSAYVQRPQRRKVEIRRALQRRVDTVRAITTVLQTLEETFGESLDDLPVSEPGRRVKQTAEEQGPEFGIVDGALVVDGTLSSARPRRW